MDARTPIAVHPSYRKARRQHKRGENVAMSHKAVAVAALIAVFSVAAGAQPAAPTVTIDSGKLAGNQKDGMMSFLGIPYAAPPTGDLRWRAPQPVKTWQGTRQAAEFGPVCRQTADWEKAPQSEDCLTLNVWAPVNKASKPYPVLFFIYGGGFDSGAGSDWGPESGKSIVQNGMIFVTMNYRLGVFGFFAHPELSAEASDHASGNQALRDQIAALQWTKHNIAAFGGDPDRITIAGNSSGGISVTALTVSPLARGLFRRCIAQSGVIDPLPTKATAERFGTELGEALKAPHLGDLRKLSAEDLLKQNWQAMPHLDGAVFTEQPQQSFAAGHQNKMPVLLGWNADEGVDFSPAVTAANYESELQKSFDPQIVLFLLAQYPGKTDAQAMASSQRLTNDLEGQQHFNWATMQQKTNTQPVYIYYYVHSPAGPDTARKSALPMACCGASPARGTRMTSPCRNRCSAIGLISPKPAIPIAKDGRNGRCSTARPMRCKDWVARPRSRNAETSPISGSPSCAMRGNKSKKTASTAVTLNNKHSRWSMHFN
jgi:para-nitrobenzyl esterase